MVLWLLFAFFRFQRFYGLGLSGFKVLEFRVFRV